MDIFKTVPGFLPAHIVDLRGEDSEGAFFALAQAALSKFVAEIAEADDRAMDHIGVPPCKINSCRQPVSVPGCLPVPVGRAELQ